MVFAFVKKNQDAIFVLSTVLVAFMFRYWHLSSTGWTEGENSFLLGMQTENGSPFHFSDSDYYHLLAINYLNGEGLNLPFPPPFTIFFLVASYSVFGVDFFSVKLVYAVVGSLALVPLYMTARLSFGRAEATVTIILCALSFNLIFLVGGLNIENIYLFTLSLSLLLFTIIYKTTEMTPLLAWLLSFVFGASSAVSALTRSEFVLIFLILALLVLLKKGLASKKKIEILFFTALGFFILILPWGYRNYHYMKNFNMLYPAAGLPLFVPTSLNGPLNFYQGHNPKANGTYTPQFLGSLSRGYQGSVDFTNDEHLSYMAEGYKLGFQFIFNNPSRELSLIPAKVGIFLDGLANGFFLNNFPPGLTGGVLTMADSFVPGPRYLIPTGLLLFLAGLISLRRSREFSALKYLPALLLAIVLMVNLGFYGLSRLVYPILPYYFMMVSVGVVFLLRIAGLLEKIRPLHVGAFLAVALFIGFVQSRGVLVLEKKMRGGATGYSLTLKEITGRDIM